MTTGSATRGSALLAVLWLSAALAAIAFSLSSTVRSETDRTSTAVDGLRAYYLAQGGVQRAALELLWRATNPGPGLIPAGSTQVDYVFPTGNVHVEIIPETAKLDVNHAAVQDLYRLALALGVAPDRAQEIAAAIDDWRRPAPQGSPFDLYYSSLIPSFRPPHASFQEIEELLLVKGITPDIFYGTYVPADEGASEAAPADTAADANAPRLMARDGLADCLTVYGSSNQVDANSAAPAVLAAVGVPPDAIQALLARRRVAPITDPQLRAFLASIGAPSARLRIGANSIVLLRATARLRLADGQLSDLKRTVAAQVKYMPPQYNEPLNFLRWYDNAWSH
jgi:general secretion pathway protein K